MSAEREWPAPFKPAIPTDSKVDALRNGNGIIDLNSQVANRSFKLGVPEQKLNGPQIAGLSINKRCFGAA